VSPIISSTPLPQEITTLIIKKAKRLVGRYRFSESDRQEIEQQIIFEVLRRRSTVDEARARQMGFLIMLVQHAVADIVAARRAASRDYRREEGVLSQWILASTSEHPLYREWMTRGEQITEQESRVHRGLPYIDPEDIRDLAIDMSDAAASLPDHLREIYTRLKELGSARAVANAVGMHPSSVYDAIKMIKDHFQKAGLEIYLSKPRANPTVSDARR